MKELHRHDFVLAFAQRDPELGPMPKDELIKRLSSDIQALESAKEKPERLVIAASNCVCGALIRLAQAYGDKEVEEKVWALVKEVVTIVGI